MPDLSARLSHLEALREGHEQAVVADPTNPRPTGEYWLELIRSAPWLIKMARQAEKLVAALEAVRGLLPDDFEQDEFNPHDLLSARLIEFEAIKKEAENGSR